MESERLRVYNLSRESFLSLEVAPVDTIVEPVKKLIGYLSFLENAGLWLTHYRGIPAGATLPPFDLIYLDDDLCVVQEVESYPSPQPKVLHARTTSALALPAHTVFATQARPGDQLAICSAQEMLLVLEAHRSGRRGNGAEEPGAGSPPPSPLNSGGSVPSPTEDRSRQLQQAILQLNRTEPGSREPESTEKKKGSWLARFKRWLDESPSDRQRSQRYPLPGLVAYHWTGGTPQAYHLGDISESGFYLLTEERPMPGTLILMTLQKTDADGDDPENSIAVRTRVVRWGPDGVGFAFAVSRLADANKDAHAAGSGVGQKALKAFLKRLNLPA